MFSHIKVGDFIQRRIEEKVYRVGEPIGSIRKISREARASVSTVHRAVSDLVRGGILTPGPGRGYSVASPDARSGNSLRTIGVFLSVVPQKKAVRLKTPFETALSALQGGFFNGGISTSVFGGVKDDGKGRVSFPSPESLEARRYDGLCILGYYDLVYFQKVRETLGAVVALDVDTSDVQVDCVAFDNLKSSMELVRRLASAGARRIAFVGGHFPPRHPQRMQGMYDPCVRERYDGWRLGRAAAERVPDESLAWFSPARNSARIREVIVEKIKGNSLPDAIVTEYPFDVLEALECEGIPRGRVPVAGWVSKNDQREVGQLRFAARCDYAELGRQGVEIMLRRLEDPEAPIERRLLMPEIVAGDA